MNVKHLDRHSKSERLNYILSQMRGPNEITPARLAGELGVSQRTVYRDLLSLEKGQTLKKRYSRSEGRYHLEMELTLPPVTLTPAEAFALFAAASNPATDESCFFAPELQIGLQKISASLTQKPPHPAAETLEVPSSIAPFSLSEETLRRPMIENIRKAQRGNYKILLQCWKEEEQRLCPFTVTPYLLVEKDGRWYLLAQSEELSGVRLFRMDSIRQVKNLPARFRLPRRFNPEAAFAKAWAERRIIGAETTLKLRFSAKVAQAIIRTRGKQFLSMETLPDGSLVCAVCLSRRNELNWWILSYGSSAEVLSPPELREEFARITRTMADCYSAK